MSDLLPLATVLQSMTPIGVGSAFEGQTDRTSIALNLAARMRLPGGARDLADREDRHD
jgi:hypothetical protein